MADGNRGEPEEKTAVYDAALADIPEAELTPRVRDALFPMHAEVQKLRAELSAVRGRIRELEGLANRDPLLDILNRRAFMRELDRTLAMRERYGVKACLVFIDLNDLKKINDERGHIAGDAALKHVASALSANIRQTDVAGRLGGDEFGLILTHVDQALAERKAKLLAEEIEQRPVETKDGQFPARISYGVTEIDHEMTVAQAIEIADRAMYAKKRRKASGDDVGQH